MTSTQRLKTSSEVHGLSADEVLRHLRPELVVLLARLFDEPRPGLAATVELMPFADRVVMTAFGMVETDRPRTGRRGLVRTTPFLDEVRVAAARLVISMVEPTDVYECFHRERTVGLDSTPASGPPSGAEAAGDRASTD